MLIMGDPRQMLYDFYEVDSRADTRFMTRIEQLIPRKKWAKHTLTTSFRTTQKTAEFLNQLTSMHMIPRAEQGTHVEVHVCDVRVQSPNIIRDILRKTTDYARTETLILLPSTNTRSVSTEISRFLIRSGIPVFVIRSGDAVDVLSDAAKSTKGRVVIRTYHSAKGLQTPFVLVVHSAPLDSLKSNPLYVALTRSTQKLILLQECTMISKSEVDRLHLVAKVHLHAQPVAEVLQRSPYVPTRHTCNGLFRFMDYTRIDHLLTYTTHTIVHEPLLDELDTMVSFDEDKTFVNMAVIYCHAALLLVEHTRTGCIQKRFCRNDVDLRRLWSSAVATPSILERCLKIATYHDACTSCYMDKILDVREYVTQESLELQYRHDVLLPLIDGTRWHTHATLQHGENTITACSTVRSDHSCTIVICKPATAKEDLLYAALTGIVFDVSQTRIVNIFDGSAVDVQCVDKRLFLDGIFHKTATNVLSDLEFLSVFTID
jgi:hypothetical protein